MAEEAGPFLELLDQKYSSGEQMLARIAKTQLYFELSFTQQDHQEKIQQDIDQDRLARFISGIIRKTDKIKSHVSHKMVVDTLVSLSDLLGHNAELVKLPHAILNEIHAVLQSRKVDPT